MARHRPLRAYVPSSEGSKPELMNGFADTRDEAYPPGSNLVTIPPLIWEQNEIGWGGGGVCVSNLFSNSPCIASGGGS